MNMILGDVGTELVFTVTDDGSAVDLTSAIVTLTIKKGSTKTTKTCTVSSAIGGIARYIVQSGDFPESGGYQLALVISYPGGNTFNSTTSNLAVSPAL